MESTRTQTPIIAVLGGTGTQGRGVVEALLKDTHANISVRALTRDVSSEASRSLLDQHKGDARLTFKSANAYDYDSLVEAFEGAYGVFAVTNTRLAGQIIQHEDDMRHELVAGKNIVKAGKICRVQHFVMSSLPNVNIASGGKFQKVLHFDQKHEIEQIAREELPSTFVLPGLFYSNLNWPQYTVQKDGTVHFIAPLAVDKKVSWVDPSYDIGIYVAEIFRRGPMKTANKAYPVVGPKTSIRDMVETFESETSKRAVASPSTIEEWGDRVSSKAGAGYREDIEQMMEWINYAPEDKICYGTVSEYEDLSFVDLGVRASSFSEWRERHAWQGP